MQMVPPVMMIRTRASGIRPVVEMLLITGTGSVYLGTGAKVHLCDLLRARAISPSRSARRQECQVEVGNALTCSPVYLHLLARH